MRFTEQRVFNATTDAATIASAIVDTEEVNRISCQAVFSDGSCAGTFKLQASNDPAGATAPTHWFDIPNTSQTVTAGSAVLVPATEISYRWVRAVLTVTTPGVGTVTANLFGLGF